MRVLCKIVISKELGMCDILKIDADAIGEQSGANQQPANDLESPHAILFPENREVKSKKIAGDSAEQEERIK